MTARPSAIAAGLLALSLQTPQFRSGIDVVRFDVVVLDTSFREDLRPA